MNDLAVYERNLPDTIEDVSRFLLFSVEKAKAMKAEIRAIEKLRLAQEVYEQKKAELRTISELILDASVRIGEFTKTLPKANKGNQYTGKMVIDSTVYNQIPKQAAVQDLGFTQREVSRFETLASNKDLVEQEKAAAREEGRLPTRTNILDMARERKQMQERKEKEDFKQIDTDFDNLSLFRKTVITAGLYGVSENKDGILDSVVRAEEDFADLIKDIETQIRLLTTIKSQLILRKGKST